MDLGSLGFVNQSIDVYANVTHALIFLCPVDEGSRCWEGVRIHGAFENDEKAKEELRAFIPDLIKKSPSQCGVFIIKSIASEGAEGDRIINCSFIE